MSKKSPRIAALIAGYAGGRWPAHYLGFFDCFNQGLFYEAHDVLEERWLAEGKAGANYAFYKGLIQLAGAFVHLQKARLRPAVALFDLAANNLRNYPADHDGLDLREVLALIVRWRAAVEVGGYQQNPLETWPRPQLQGPTLDAVARAL